MLNVGEVGNGAPEKLGEKVGGEEPVFAVVRS